MGLFVGEEKHSLEGKLSPFYKTSYQNGITAFDALNLKIIKTKHTRASSATIPLLLRYIKPGEKYIPNPQFYQVYEYRKPPFNLQEIINSHWQQEAQKNNRKVEEEITKAFIPQYREYCQMMVRINKSILDNQYQWLLNNPLRNQWTPTDQSKEITNEELCKEIVQQAYIKLALPAMNKYCHSLQQQAPITQPTIRPATIPMGPPPPRRPHVATSPNNINGGFQNQQSPASNNTPMQVSAMVTNAPLYQGQQAFAQKRRAQAPAPQKPTPVKRPRIEPEAEHTQKSSRWCICS